MSDNPNTPHEPVTAPHRGIAGGFFLAMVALLMLGAGITFTRDPQKFAELKPDFTSVVKGRFTSQAEKLYQKNFGLLDPATGLWGALRFVLFRTGNEGVVVGKGDWLFTEEEFKAYPKADKELAAKVDTIAAVDAYLRMRGIQLAIVLIPAKARIYPEALGGIPFPAAKQALYTRTLHELRGRGVYAPDLATLFARYANAAQLFMHTDTHWTPAGAMLAASTLAADLKRDCSVLALKHTSFATTESAGKAYSGDLERFLPLGPLTGKIGPGAEPLVTRDTSQQGEGADALFASEEIPVILVGTSYSALKQWNFDGALRETLEADVLNLADEGKGPMVPMDGLLAGNQLETVKPKLVIWEIPERFLEVHYDTKFDRVKNLPAAPAGVCSLASLVQHEARK